MKRLISSLLVSFALLTGGAFAQDKLSGQPTAAELPFVQAVTADLNARFPNPDAARKAGYLRYTDEDETGAISYANRQWTSGDAQHPSQLWYDIKGRLLGADFSVLQADSLMPPHLFGVDPRRWQKFGAHVHYGLRGPNGTTVYGATGAKAMAKVSGSVAHPDASALVAAGIAKSVKEVRFVFPFPAIWDLTIWVLPNRDGAFAEANPEVKPAGKTGGMSM
jgi:hypothetical protein